MNSTVFQNSLSGLIAGFGSYEYMILENEREVNDTICLLISITHPTFIKSSRVYHKFCDLNIKCELNNPHVAAKMPELLVPYKFTVAFSLLHIIWCNATFRIC